MFRKFVLSDSINWLMTVWFRLFLIFNFRLNLIAPINVDIEDLIFLI